MTNKLDKVCDDCDRVFFENERVIAEIDHNTIDTENGWVILIGCEGFNHRNRGNWG